MRTAFTRLQQRHYHAYLRLASRRISPCSSHNNVVAREPLIGGYSARRSCTIKSSTQRLDFARFASSTTYTAEPVPFVDLKKDGSLKAQGTRRQPSFKHQGVIPTLTTEQRKDPVVWMKLLDKYLPANLRFDQRDVRRTATINDDDAALQEIFKITDNARKKPNAGTEILAYMILNGRGRAALHIINMMLARLASRTVPEIPRQTPSNLSWGVQSLDELCTGPIDIVTTLHTSKQPIIDCITPADDLRYTTTMSGTLDSTMNKIWSTLGEVVIQCADLPEIQATEALKYVMLALGQIHKLDLVPESVYSYRLSPLATTVQRPPILHLVSSRVLTALSDAAWRDQQDQIIEKAASHGVSYKEIGRDPPGGRFRLKVRPLAREVWLEFILWCCVEGGFTTAGARIVQMLRQQTDQPWFTVTWSSSDGASQTAPTVHWDRVRTRHGGSVGLIEGYSREKPFVEMPSRTVSTEVVLGLIDVSIDCMSRGGGSRGNPAEIVQKSIVDMVTFLEPHDLPIGYFNYLAVRLLQTGAIDSENDTRSLDSWYGRLVFMKSLEAARARPLSHMSYQLHSLSAQSELFAGILHQVLDGYVQAGDVHRALDTFNKLQELIDTSKLQAIDVFLHKDARPDSVVNVTDNVDDHYITARRDFVGSHGQLPSYKLAALLDLATDSNLTGFVEWLLYNTDPDSPLVPETLYASTSMARVLLRFADITQDRSLVHKVIAIQDLKTLKPTVKFLRAKANAFISDLDFPRAKGALSQLAQAQGGGCGLVNIAHLVATLIKLESKACYESVSEMYRSRALSTGRRLLRNILSGRYRARGGDYRQDITKRYRQQVAAMLHILKFYPDSPLAEIAATCEHNYPAGNDYNFAPTMFNTILEAVVQSKGSEEGMRLWETFCLSPSDVSSRRSITEADLDNDGLAYEDEEDDVGSSPSVATVPLENQNTTFQPFVDDTEQQSPPQSDVNLSVTDFGDFGQLTPSFIPQYDATTSENDEDFEPVVVPTQRTLRIIVRQAVKEQREAEEAPSRSGSLQKSRGNVREVLKWAIQQYKSMGIPGDLISVEVQRPLASLDLERIQDTPRARPVLAAAKNRTRRRPVEKLFVGREDASQVIEHEDNVWMIGFDPS